jgi:membrane protein
VTVPLVPAQGHPDVVRRTVVDRVLWTATTAYSQYNADRCRQIAAAISYHVLFALVPFFTLVGTIAALFLDDPERRRDFTEYLVRRFPLTAQAGVDIGRILSDLPTPASLIGVLSIVALVWSASGMTAPVRVGVTAAFDHGLTRPYFHSKLVDVLLVLAVGCFFVLSFALSLVVNAIEQWSERVAGPLAAAGFGRGSVLAYVVPVMLGFAVLLALYRLVPWTRLPFRQLWIGALFAAVASEAIKIGFSYYLVRIARYDVLYGSLGAVFAFLLVVYLQAAVLLLGAELASAWSKSALRPREESQQSAPFRRRILDALKGLFVPGRR